MAITTAHELVHRPDPRQRAVGLALLALAQRNAYVAQGSIADPAQLVQLPPAALAAGDVGGHLGRGLSVSERQQLFDRAMQEGMLTLKQDGILKVLKGDSDMEEIRRVCIN